MNDAVPSSCPKYVVLFLSVLFLIEGQVSGLQVKQEYTVVSSADELAFSLSRGDTHVEIREHMIFLNDTGFSIVEGTRSIRGNCSATPSFDKVVLRNLPWQVGRCVIFASGKFVVIERRSPKGALSDASSIIWLDSLELYAEPESTTNIDARQHDALVKCMESPATILRITNTNFHGAPGDPMPAVYSKDCVLSVSGSRFEGFNGPFAVGSIGNVASVDTCLFSHNNNSLAGEWPRMAALQALDKATVIVSMSQFDNNRADVGIQSVGDGKIFMDNSTGVLVTDGIDADVHRVDDLLNEATSPAAIVHARDGELPTSSVAKFAHPDSPYFIQLQADTLEARQCYYTPSSCSSPPSSSRTWTQVCASVLAAVTALACAVAVLFLLQRRRYRACGKDNSTRSYSYPSDSSSVHGLQAAIMKIPNQKAVSKTAWALNSHRPLITLSSGWITYNHMPSSTLLSQCTSTAAPSGTIRSDTPKLQDDTFRLEVELTEMERTHEVFAGRYLIIRERTSGGQAYIQFARSADGGYFQYAIKFYLSMADYVNETALYENDAVRSTMPTLLSACANSTDTSTGEAPRTSPNGFVFPPHIIVERGTTMHQWREAEERHMFAVLNMFNAIAEHLERLHAAGHVHRDLKPENVLLLLQTQQWKLIDYGISAKVGSLSPPSCTLTYAAPEVVKAFQRKERISVHPSQDIWALGVIVFECLSHTTLFSRLMAREDLYQHANGTMQYPWERPETCPQRFRKVTVRVRDSITACLDRDPEKRPTAAQVVKQIVRMGNSTTEIAVC